LETKHGNDCGTTAEGAVHACVIAISRGKRKWRFGVKLYSTLIDEFLLR
jgi:hypothetical protein